MSSWSTAPERPKLSRGEVHLWRVIIPEAPLDELRPELSEDELARVDRFLVERPKQELVAGRGVLRKLLGRYLGRDAAALRFDYGENGKPRLAAEQEGLSFNLSHSHGRILIAFSLEGELGVDIERVRDDMEHLRVSERFFSEAEREVLRSLPQAHRPLAFFRCWTRKEALLKARGTGLRTPLRDFDVSLHPESAAEILATRFDPPDVQDWTLHHVDPGPGYTAALSLSFEPTRIETWEWGADET